MDSFNVLSELNQRLLLKRDLSNAGTNYATCPIWFTEFLLMPIAGNVLHLPKNKSLPVQLQAREYEVFTVVPVKRLSKGAAFAPIGLLKMFNSGGAITDLNYGSPETGIINIRVRGCGVFGAYSSVRPERILIDMKEEKFDYEEKSGLISLNLRVPEKELYQWNLTVEL